MCLYLLIITDTNLFFIVATVFDQTLILFITPVSADLSFWLFPIHASMACSSISDHISILTKLFLALAQCCAMLCNCGKLACCKLNQLSPGHINFSPLDIIWILPGKINRLLLKFWPCEITGDEIRIWHYLFLSNKSPNIIRFLSDEII